MNLSFRTPGQLVRLSVAAAQASASKLLDLRVGSTLLAVFEANSLVASWVQDQVIRVLRTTRLATASGDDASSFVADFGMTRFPASASSGTVTFERLAPVGSATVPVGSRLRTADLSQSFLVTADSSHELFDPAVASGAGGYVMPSGLRTATLPVVAELAGAAGDVEAGSIVVLSGVIPGIDVITNAATLQGGNDAEGDRALKIRFPLYIASLSKATKIAIEAAIAGVQQGLSYTVVENYDEAGVWCPGFFVVTIDDGTGSAPDSLLTAVYSAVDAVRAFTVRFAVHRPTAVTVNVTLTVSLAPGANRAAAIATVATAIRNFIGGLGIGQTLPFSRVAAVAYAASPFVTNVHGVNVLRTGDTGGGMVDIEITASGRILAGTVSVS